MIRKVKHDGSVTTVEITEKKGEQSESRVVISKKTPHPDFVKALGRFTDPVVTLLGTSAEWGESLEIRSVSLSDDVNGDEQVVVSCLKRLDGMAFNFHTPMVSTKDRGEKPPTLTDAMHEAIDGLIEETQHYLAGTKAAQAELFPEGPLGAGFSSDVETQGDARRVMKDVYALGQILAQCDLRIPPDALGELLSHRTDEERADAKTWGEAMAAALKTVETDAASQELVDSLNERIPAWLGEAEDANAPAVETTPETVDAAAEPDISPKGKKTKKQTAGASV